MSGYEIEAVLFDQNQHCAGFKFENDMTKQAILDTPLNGAELTAEMNDFRGVLSHTRVVGFRTTKSCESAKQILSVQPIYYSVDEKVCKERLVQLTPGLLEEIPSYGPECAVVAAAATVDAATALRAANTSQATEARRDDLTVLTFIIVWISFAILVGQTLG